MASEVKKTKADPTPKNEVAPKKEASPVDKSATEAAPSKAKGGAADAAPSKAESGEKAAAAPAGYSRGEGQKAVTQAYKDNWNAIFANKKKKKR